MRCGFSDGMQTWCRGSGQEAQVAVPGPSPELLGPHGPRAEPAHRRPLSFHPEVRASDQRFRNHPRVDVIVTTQRGRGVGVFVASPETPFLCGLGAGRFHCSGVTFLD